MKTMIKTIELAGAALEWAVAKCEGEDYQPDAVYDGIGHRHEPHLFSTDWEQGGPIIERESITILRCDDDWGVDSKGFTTSRRIPVWGAVHLHQFGTTESTEHQSHDEMFQIHESDVVYGPTPLIAAMRAYVISRLGDTVSVPKELLSKPKSRAASSRQADEDGDGESDTPDSPKP